MFSQEVSWLLSEKYAGKKSEAFFTDLEQLKAGVPLAYLIGSIPFLNTTIYLDSHPLIPRLETEFWVEQFINTIKEPLRTLDLCAGSGAVGVAIAKNFPKSEIDFAEIDSLHLPTITKNCLQNNLNPNLINIYQSDLFTLKSGRPLPRYHYILSNPPYIDESLNRTDVSVIKNEPALALYGGKDGLELISKIIQEASNHLFPAGQLWLEHEPEQVKDIEKLALEQGFSIDNQKDQYGVFRYSILMLQ